MSRRVNVEIVEELTEVEQRERLRLERKVERAVFEGDRAWQELRDRRLYRSTHSSFEQYCRERFGFSRDAAYLKIRASQVYDNITNYLPTNGRQIPLPSNERQLRHIAKAKLDPEAEAQAWVEAVDEVGGKIPSGRIVKDVVQRIKEKIPVPNPYHVGEVCGFVPKDIPELKGKSKCWAIVKEVHEWSCTVQAWDGEYQVRVENLKSQELLPVHREQVQLLCDRITRLRQINDLDRAALAHLKHLGEQLALTEVEEKMLSLLEEYYQVARR